MKTLEISYNPYKMTTTMLIDGVDVCNDGHYEKISTFLKDKTPLQTWIEPISYRDWGGLVNEVSDPETNDEVKVIFSGRDIDFEDLKRSVADQNEEREKHNKNTRVIYHFEHKERLDDKKLSQNIEEVYKELQSERFSELVKQRTTDGLRQKYDALEENYMIAKESEFYIVFAGTYSSGKSTLLNALIRHNILPTSDGTCTSKNCRILHDGSLGHKVSLACLGENDEIVVEKRVFENDADCAAAFLEICPNNAEDKHPEIDMMELGVDLSHLYPESVNSDKFTIVLIDTPGMDSSKSIKNGTNKHAEIALEAVSDENKPMVVLCVDKKYENESIGEFMGEIIVQSQENSGFNDRFLFLINKSDDFQYDNNLCPEKIRTEFARYLTDHTKMNIAVDQEEELQLAESASHFVPRVFMTAALVEFAIQQKAYDFIYDRADKDKTKLLDAYEDFEKKIWRRSDTDYYLSGYCDIPNYRKDEIEEEFEAAIESGDKVRAVQLQCGMVSVELAIRDYIERYAYPIKVRGLLDTFEDILDDVKGFTKATLFELKKAEAELREKENEKKDVRERKKGVEGKIAALEEAKGKINEQLRLLIGIQFDSDSLKKAISEFRADIETSKEFIFIEQHPIVGTQKKSHNEVENEISSCITNIKETFECALNKMNQKLEEIKKGHAKQVLDVFEFLKAAVNKLEESGALKQGEYKFTDCVFWATNFSNMNIDSLVSDVKKTVIDSTIKMTKKHNQEKDEWAASRNLFKKIKSLFMPNDIIVTENIDGYYETEPIRQYVYEYFVSMTREGENMENYFINALENSKRKVRDLIDELIQELIKFIDDIDVQEKWIAEISGSMKKIGKEIAMYKGTYEWLNVLKSKMEGV